jgi:hypothetical protein
VTRVSAATERSGDWQITGKIDEAAKTKTFNVKLEAWKTAHDGLFLPPDALLQLVCLRGQPLIHVMFAFQIGSKADSEIKGNTSAEFRVAGAQRGIDVLNTYCRPASTKK